MAVHITEETLGRMRTRENEAEGAGSWASEIAKSMWAATVSDIACTSVDLSAIFQSQSLTPSSRGQWMKH